LKVIALGCGHIGSVLAKDFAESVEDAEIICADRNRRMAKATASMIDGASWITLDVEDFQNLVDTLKRFDLVLGALPGDYGFNALKAAVEAEVDAVDVSFTPENPLELNRFAKDSGVTIIPDCGVAPGLSNMLVGYAASKLNLISEVQILVGGIPETLVPPLDYTLTWSAEDLIDEYVRDVHIFKDGSLIQVPALSGLEEVDFPGIGKLEAFYTDGLRTLISFIPGVENMWEKTLRYPGHVEKVKLLKTLGFFDDEAVVVKGSRISPRLVTARLFERSLKKAEVRDVLAMNVEVKGVSLGEEKGYRYRLLERFDRKRAVSAMARATAYTASIVAGIMVKGGVTEKGVIPPERLGEDKKIVELILSELKTRNVKVVETSI
jgi:saccharopine dehydrogenase-like NADP-dependent oxidoreductase